LTRRSPICRRTGWDDSLGHRSHAVDFAVLKSKKDGDMSQDQTVGSCRDLIANLRHWRETTPDAWILRAADNLERLERELTATRLHAKTLNAVLGAAEDERDRAVKLLSTLLASAHRNERDYMPSEWHEAVDDAKAFLKEVENGQ